MKKSLVLFCIPALFAVWAWASPEVQPGCDGVHPSPECPGYQAPGGNEALGIPEAEASSGDYATGGNCYLKVEITNPRRTNAKSYQVEIREAGAYEWLLMAEGLSAEFRIDLGYELSNRSIELRVRSVGEAERATGVVLARFSEFSPVIESGCVGD